MRINNRIYNAMMKTRRPLATPALAHKMGVVELAASSATELQKTCGHNGNAAMFKSDVCIH
jgi:L-cystine uptake protein TcyP (sodium:dicarboxylate symporter family)